MFPAHVVRSPASEWEIAAARLVGSCHSLDPCFPSDWSMGGHNRAPFESEDLQIVTPVQMRAVFRYFSLAKRASVDAGKHILRSSD